PISSTVAMCLPSVSRARRTRTPHGADERVELVRILDARAGFDAARDVDRPRLDGLNRGRDIVRGEAPGEHDIAFRIALADLAREPPVEGRARSAATRGRRVEEERAPRPDLQRVDIPRTADRNRLPHRPLDRARDALDHVRVLV